MNDAMNCAETRSQFWLLEYGELTFEQEERLETHLEQCTECRLALERERKLFAAFDGIAVEPSASLLRQCRAELAARMEADPGSPPVRHGWWEQFTQALTGTGRFALRPAGALAMLVLGFGLARLMPAFLNSPDPGIVNQVRDVQASVDGQVRIVLDETRQRTVYGRPDDQRIRGLLLQAAKDPSDAGLRQASLAVLNDRAEVPDIRQALLYALQNDQNAGVRLNAMHGLKAFAAEPDVRGVLSHTLLSDPNPGVRMQAIDLLTEGSASVMDRQVIGALQQLMMSEDNPYLRQRSQQVLEAINASTEIY